jgi:hypothetical protein
MSIQLPPSSNRKDLAYLRNLPRSPALSYLKKQAQPKAPVPKTSPSALPAPVPQPSDNYPEIGLFSQAWNFVAEYVRHRLGRRYPFQSYAAGDPDNGVYAMSDDAETRIAMAGDWATGTDEAAAIAKLMLAYQPHYSIHLGDVYFVGDPAEVSENFLGKPNPANGYDPVEWPKGSLGAFALNGNHEMYSLGTAYFSQMLPALGRIADGKPQGQAASFFCIENAHWRIIALDTGYNSIGLPVVEYFSPPDCALPAELIDWLRTTIKPQADDPRGIILLSHHQPYSRYEAWYPKPAQQLAEFFSRPVLWFWGHEHRMAIYDEFDLPAGLQVFGRCIGHGGMPIELPPDNPVHPECKVEFVDRRVYPNDENLVISFNGFARMALNQDNLKVEYVDVLGAVIFSEAWVVQGGALKRI